MMAFWFCNVETRGLESTCVCPWVLSSSMNAVEIREVGSEREGAAESVLHEAVKDFPAPLSRAFRPA